MPTKRGAHLALSLERLRGRLPRGRCSASACRRRSGRSTRSRGSWAERSEASRTGRARTRAQREAASGAPRPPRATLHDEFAAGERGRRVPARSPIVDARQPKRLALKVEVPVEDMAKLGQAGSRSRAARRRRAPRAPSIWSSIHPRLLELDPRAPSDAALRQQPAPRRAAGRRAERAGRRDARARAPRLAGARAARRDRGRAEGRPHPGARRHLVARARHRHGRHRSRRSRSRRRRRSRAACSASAAPATRSTRSARASSSRSSAATWSPARRSRAPCTRARSRRRATRATRSTCSRSRSWRWSRWTRGAWTTCSPPCAAPRRSPALVARRLRGRARHAVGPLPVRRVRGAAAAPHLGPDRRHADARGRAPGAWPSPTPARFPTAASTACSSPGAARAPARVGELDEEMVFESRVGETFVLGASTWRIEEITHDRVLVSPAPGEPGKMPFWKGDRPGRPLELGLAIGRLVRELRGMPRGRGARQADRGSRSRPHARPRTCCSTSPTRSGATQAVPDDRTIVIERCRDELGDWRVCVLSPFGGRVLAPWAMAVEARIREQRDIDVETMWSDDGFVVRFPDTDEPPDAALLLPPAEEVERLLLRQLGGTALFAARFREVAARALLLPRRRPGARTPLWQQRKRAADLLAVAVALRLVPGAARDLPRVPARSVRHAGARRPARPRRQPAIRTVDGRLRRPRRRSPRRCSSPTSPTSSTTATRRSPSGGRRRCWSTRRSCASCSATSELRELLDPAVIDEVEQQLQRLEPRYRARSRDALHDLLLRLGDLDRGRDSRAVRDRRPSRGRFASWSRDTARDRGAGRRARRASSRSKTPPATATRSARRCRSACPDALLEPVADPVGDLVLRYARTHGPFTAEAVAARLGLAAASRRRRPRAARGARPRAAGRVPPGRTGREWCEADVLRQHPAALAREAAARGGAGRAPLRSAASRRRGTASASRRAGLDALLDVIEQLQGAPLPASLLEREILPARVDGLPAGRPRRADRRGRGRVGGRRSRSASATGASPLYLADHLAQLLPPPAAAGRTRRARHPNRRAPAPRGCVVLRRRPRRRPGGGYPRETVDALWDLVWRGLVTNDTFHALRAFTQPPVKRSRRHDRTRRSGRAA